MTGSQSFGRRLAKQCPIVHGEPVEIPEPILQGHGLHAGRGGWTEDSNGIEVVTEVRHSDGASGGARPATDVKRVAAVPSRAHHHAAQLRQIVGSRDFGVVGGSHSKAVHHRQVDDIQMVCEVAIAIRIGRPFECIEQQARVAGPAENLERIERRTRHHAWSDRERGEIQRVRVAPGVGGANGQDPQTGCNAGH